MFTLHDMYVDTTLERFRRHNLTARVSNIYIARLLYALKYIFFRVCETRDKASQLTNLLGTEN